MVRISHRRRCDAIKDLEPELQALANATVAFLQKLKKYRGVDIGSAMSLVEDGARQITYSINGIPDVNPRDNIVEFPGRGAA